MRLTRFLPALLAITLTASALSAHMPGVAASEAAAAISKGEIVVELQPGASIDPVNERNKTSTILHIYGTNFYRLRIPTNKKEKKWRKRLAADPDVLSASFNPVVANPSLFARATASFPEGFATPGLTIADFEAQQRLFELLKLEDVKLRSRGAGTIVAVIDTGIDRAHPALASHMWTNTREQEDGIDNDADGLIDDVNGWNFVDGNNDTAEMPGNPQTTVAGHGTFIAGLVALLAPECEIMSVRAFPADGVSDAFTVAAAIKYAADHGANVINLSLGSSDPSELLQSAILDARARGITIVAAVGNDDNENTPQFPSSLAEVMAVAAIELSGEKASFSNFGSHIDVCAPGVRLVSTFPGNREDDYARWSGTSFAAPLAAAEAALVRSVDPRQSDVRRVIEATAVSVDELNPGLAGKLGKGRIDPLQALQSLNSNTNPRSPADFHSEINLVSLGGAFGKASITVTGGRQEFTVEAHALNARTTYKLLVDGKLIATDVAASLGSLNFDFVGEPGGPPLPPGIVPVANIHHVELRDSLDRVVLEGTFNTDNANPNAGLFEREARLLSTGLLAQASGNAFIRVEVLPAGGRREKLSLSAEGLVSESSYRVVVDATNVGETLARSGFLRVTLTSDGTMGQLLPPSLRPVTTIRHLEIQDSIGRAVLRGDFAVSQ